MSGTPTILIVEDDPVFRRVLSFTVARSGFQVETANHGEEGYQRLIKGGIDFLVTDLQMPIWSGIDLLEQLDNTPNYTRPQTILCTAKGLELDSDSLIQRFRLAEIMHKPFSPRKLTAAIERHCGSTDSDETTRPNQNISPLGSTEDNPASSHTFTSNNG